jgi:phosphoglycolate phosphatase-like HAD superfamily hydrolase
MQAYLFDFDGTLVDSAPDLTRALDLALNRAGLPGVGLELGKQMVVLRHQFCIPVQWI